MYEITEEDITRTMTILFYLEEQGLMDEYIREYETCDYNFFGGTHDLSRVAWAFYWKDSARGHDFWSEIDNNIAS